VFPRASREEGSIWTNEFRRGVALLLAALLAITVPLFLFAVPLTVTLLGEPYRASAEVLRVILAGMLLATVNQPLAAALQARGYEYFVAATIAVSAALGLIAIAIGAYLGGAAGGAIGFVVLQFSILAALLMRTAARVSTTTPAKQAVNPAHL
jgi:O-antigen/teichoic acid export membrane protein